MADRRRIVTISPVGTVTLVKDLEDATSYFSVKDSWEAAPGKRKTVYAKRTRRYAGGVAAAESHENGTVKWKMLVTGASADLVNQNVESALNVLERGTLDTYLEWRPDGATYSTYYEIRGPADWNLTYSWVQYAGAQVMIVDVSLPVGPLARGTLAEQTFASTTLPATITLPSVIAGSAPALCDVKIRTSGGSAAPIWALIAWQQTSAATALAGSVAPFGKIEAETGILSTWATFTGDATFSDSSGVRTTSTTTASSASASFPVDPSVMEPDEFTMSTVALEVWGRIELASTVVSPKLTLSVEPNAGSNFGTTQYSAEYGSAGKLLTSPSSGTAFRFIRLGVVTLPVDTVTPLKWNLKVTGSWSAGGSGAFGLDYICVVPAKSRALSKTAVANDGTYPKFIIGTVDTTKTIRSDLSGLVASAAGYAGQDSGLGGSLVEIPSGATEFFVKLSSLVPDDPTSDTSSEQLSHTGVTGAFEITPRYWIVK
jgi:hypothetical protein